jgi:type II secretory pathway pseudopilin PulG
MSINRHEHGEDRYRTAFSLIEVLVVAFIIALLISILLPSLLRARQAARNLTCASHLRAFGNALTLYRTGARDYPKVEVPRRVEQLSHISSVAELLVRQSLGEPRGLYCPVSLHDDPFAEPPKKAVLDEAGHSLVEYWKRGQISYIYLSGITDLFPDAAGNPTFNPERESPDPRRNTRAVLAGDRTIRFGPKGKNIIGSNHGDQGGWFYFVAGDVGWRSMSTLAAHPTAPYIWYWPRTASPPKPAER